MENQESLNLNDLKLMAQIIKIVSTRGAIQAEEMTAVGALYNKLVAFIKLNSQEEKSSEEHNEAVSTETQGN